MTQKLDKEMISRVELVTQMADTVVQNQQNNLVSLRSEEVGEYSEGKERDRQKHPHVLFRATVVTLLTTGAGWSKLQRLAAPPVPPPDCCY